MGIGDEALALSRSGGGMLDPPFQPSRCSESPLLALGGTSPGQLFVVAELSGWHEEGQGGLELPLLVLAVGGAQGSLNVPGLLIVMRRRM